MDDGFPRKVTKEEKLEQLMTKAANKGTEVVSMLSNQVFDAEDSDGETVKIKKPKAESVPDVKGMDEQKTKVTETITKEFQKPSLEDMGDAKRYILESLEVAQRVYSEMQEMVEADNTIMKPKEMETLARQISRTMQLVAKKKTSFRR